MKIIRDGVEIELTKEELYDAWSEKEHDYACEELRIGIVERLEADGVTFDSDVVAAMVETAYYIYIKSVGYGCEESWSIGDAVCEVLEQYEDGLDHENTIS